MQLEQMREYQVRYSGLIERLGELEDELLARELAEKQLGFYSTYATKLGSLRTGVNEAISKMMLYMVTT